MQVDFKIGLANVKSLKSPEYMAIAINVKLKNRSDNFRFKKFLVFGDVVSGRGLHWTLISFSSFS